MDLNKQLISTAIPAKAEIQCRAFWILRSSRWRIKNNSWTQWWQRIY